MKTCVYIYLTLLSSGVIIYLALPAQATTAAHTWVVNTVLDDSPTCTPDKCTLRSAISAAASDDTITFKTDVRGTISLNIVNGGLSIYKNLTINGPGAYNLIVSGSGGGPNKNFSVFTVYSGASLKLTGLSITFGWNLSGGSVLIQPGGTLIIDQCSFSDNYAR